MPVWFRKKWVQVIVVIGGALLIAAVALYLSRNALIEWVMRDRLEWETGMPAQIGRVETDLLAGRITLRDVTIFNTAEFGGTPFLVVPELTVQWGGTSGLARVHFHLAQLNLVVNAAGESNLEALQRHMRERVAEYERETDESSGDSSGGRRPGIDALEITLGEVTFHSMAQPDRRASLELGVTNRVLRDVRSTEDFQPLIGELWLRHGAGVLLENLLRGPEAEKTGRQEFLEALLGLSPRTGAPTNNFAPPGNPSRR